MEREYGTNFLVIFHWLLFCGDKEFEFEVVFNFTDDDL
jgi:hypothetical protein